MINEAVQPLEGHGDLEDLVDPLFLHCGSANARNSDSGQALDLVGGESYLQLIPIHRLPGGAFVRASVFSLGLGPPSVEMGAGPRGISPHKIPHSWS